MAHDYRDTLRPYITTYLARRLFRTTCTHLDVFLYEIPDEYVNKYTHVIVIQYRQGGRKLTKQVDFVIVRLSMVEPRALIDDATEFIDITDPVRVNAKHRLAAPKGRETAQWFKRYHHTHMRGILAGIAKLERAKGNTVSIRFHYFAEFDLNPMHRFVNHVAKLTRGRPPKSA